MSVNKHLRAAWVAVTYRKAVAAFHTARKLEENETVELADLARRCANSAFQNRAHMILFGAEEVTARQFMAHCREHFTEEIYKAVLEKPELDLAM